MFATLLLKIVPFKWWIAGAAALAIAGVIGAEYIEIQHLKTSIATQAAAIATERQAAATAALQQSEAQRAIEDQRAKAQREADDEATHLAAIAQADAAAASAAALSLRDRYAAALAALRRAGANPATDPDGKAAEGAARMLADVQQRLDAAARRYADIADQRGVAGRACEREYDALKP